MVVGRKRLILPLNIFITDFPIFVSRYGNHKSSSLSNLLMIPEPDVQ